MIHFFGSLFVGMSIFYIINRVLLHIYETDLLWRFPILSKIWYIIWCLYTYLVIAQFDQYMQIIFTLLFSSVLFMGATIDIKHFILPDEGAILLMGIGIGHYLWTQSFYGANLLLSLEKYFYHVGLQALLVGGVFYLLRFLSHGGVGLGDVKWSIANGFCLQGNNVWIMFLAAFVIGTIVALVGRYVFANKKEYIAFGPFLNGGALLAYWIPL